MTSDGSVQHVLPLAAPLTINKGHLWSPSVGEEMLDLLDRSSLGDDGVARVRQQAVAVLGHTLDPQHVGASRRTGLVVGYVQSGKTLSFTSVMALAHDNGVRLVILFSGTKQNLHKQTHSRLKRDLRAARTGGSPWLLFENPQAGSPAAAEIRTALMAAPMKGASSNPLLAGVNMRERTVVVTVMKNSTRLASARKLLLELDKSGVDMDSLSVLIVDDEADQAGLNTRAGDEEDPSATYLAIRSLRDVLPRHSYLQYTATPQAPLLLDLVNTLSPDFVAVLEPGDGYTGGKYFFEEHRDVFVKRIAATEAQQSLEEDDGPPDSLQHAFASFLVSAMLMGTRGITQASMLLHPSHTKDQHDKFARWVRGLKDTWNEVLQLPSTDVLKQDLLEDYLVPACDDLALGNALLSNRDNVAEAARAILEQLQVRTINSSELSDADVDWDSFPFWVLVGGNKLDRGYTVEGLVTTYMPRGQGGGQADTIQQRARFFGYKGAYADLCRAWLVQGTADIYERYVEHEEALRNELVDVARTGTPLKTWRRKLLIDSSLKPCRANVIGLPYVRERVKGDSWSRFERLVSDVASIDRNRGLLDDYLAPLLGGMVAHEGDPRPNHRHLVCSSPLGQVVDTLLSSWEMDAFDESTFGTLLLLLRARLDDAPSLPAEIVYMDGGRRRERAAADVKVNNLFQGRSPQGADHYPGDQVFHSEDDFTVTVQLHRVDVRRDQKSAPFLLDVPALAVWVPRRLASDLILGVD